MGESQEDQPDAGSPGRTGLSPGGWAAVAALGAAVITAGATLVTHFLPPTGPQQQVVAEPAGESSAPLTPTGTAPRSALLDRLTGTWSGPARAGSQTYTLTLVVTDSCAEGRPCGTMTTDLLPCVGTITLVKIDDDLAFDFATRSFSKDSSSACPLRTGGGDYFDLGDDMLRYRTGYDSGTSGTLRRVG